jgi:hypothetical protein
VLSSGVHRSRSSLWIGLFGLIAAIGCGDSSASKADAGRATEDADVLSCEPPEELCAGACVDPRIDPNNCGRCAETCSSGQFCENSICTAVCSDGLNACGASCVDFLTDKKHCGECNGACSRDRECRARACECPEGYSECGGICVDVATDQKNCGICARACAADEICGGGSCVCAGGARETECSDAADNDCDDLTDCFDPDCQGTTRACMGACGPGLETCGPDGKFGVCEGGNGTPEVCGDGIDQDCTGADERNIDMWEPNDSCAECAWIMTADPSGTLNAGFDSVDDPMDCFRFEGVDNSYYPEQIAVSLEGVPAGHDYDIYLYPSLAACEARTPIAGSEAAGNADELIIWSERFGTSDSASYYVRVVRFGGHSCTDDYVLRISGLN